MSCGFYATDLVMYLGHIVESGPADRVFGAPVHPYTQHCCRRAEAAPPEAVDADRAAGRATQPDRPAPHICRSTAGAAGYDKCRTTMPALREIATGHVAAVITDDRPAGSHSVAASLS